MNRLLQLNAREIRKKSVGLHYALNANVLLNGMITCSSCNDGYEMLLMLLAFSCFGVCNF